MLNSIRKTFRKYNNFFFNFGMIITLVFFVMAVVGCFYTPYNTTEMNVALKNSAPAWAHIFGCDNYGRDIFSRVMEGIRNTFYGSDRTSYGDTDRCCIRILRRKT